LGSTPLSTFLFLFFAMASHGLLDACTNGGSGIALLWPFTDTRYFAPFTPIEVSPIGLARFLSTRGAAVMASELLWVWLPCIVLALALLTARRFQSRSSSSTG
jgi:inner membrane protein